MTNVVPFPGCEDGFLIDGEPRADIADMLRDLADRAERGEIVALALAAATVADGVIAAVSTPEKRFYSILGALEVLKDRVKEREADISEGAIVTTDYDGGGAA